MTALATLVNTWGDYTEAARLGEEARRRNEARGDKVNLTLDLYALTNAAYSQGQYEVARDYAQQAYDLTEEGPKSLVYGLCPERDGHRRPGLG